VIDLKGLSLSGGQVLKAGAHEHQGRRMSIRVHIIDSKRFRARFTGQVLKIRGNYLAR
jgi:hypothetical protein